MNEWMPIVCACLLIFKEFVSISLSLGITFSYPLCHSTSAGEREEAENGSDKIAPHIKINKSINCACCQSFNCPTLCNVNHVLGIALTSTGLLCESTRERRRGEGKSISLHSQNNEMFMLISEKIIVMLIASESSFAQILLPRLLT
jgi:hypothetical protein